MFSKKGTQRGDKTFEIPIINENLRPLHKALTRARCATDNATPERASINATAPLNTARHSRVY